MRVEVVRHSTDTEIKLEMPPESQRYRLFTAEAKRVKMPLAKWLASRFEADAKEAAPSAPKASKPTRAAAFPNRIGEVEVAEVDMRTADAAALQARARHRAALAALRAQVEAEAATDWTASEIEAARAAALRCSLEMAATPPVEPPASLPEWPTTRTLTTAGL